MIDHIGVNARVAAFDEENGGDGITYNGWIIYSNGAMREQNPLGMLASPPSNSRECKELILKYWTVSYERSMKAFNEKRSLYIRHAKAEMRNAISAPPPDKNEVISELELLKSKAIASRVKMEHAQESFRASKPEWIQERENMNASNKVANQSLLEAVNLIKL